MTADKFRKKPVVIEAMQWDGTPEDATDIIDWVLANGGTASYDPAFVNRGGEDVSQQLRVTTLDSVARLFPGDWMMRGTVGEFYPCKPDVFAESYEPIRDTPVGELTDEGLNRLMQDVTGSPVKRDGQ